MRFLLHHSVDAAAERRPERPAAQFLDDVLDYAALCAASNRLAHALLARGVKRHDRVGIYMDKNIKVPVAIYGIMKAGAAYVPLDPSAPPARIAGVVRDCGIRHLVTAPAKSRGLRGLAHETTPIECLVGLDAAEDLPFDVLPWAEIDAARGGHAPDVKILDADLAYIIYTSGSTGTPKGIMHSHASGLAFARWAAAEYGLSHEDRVSNHAPLHFDLSILDYFATAWADAATVIIPEEFTKLPASYAKLIAEQRLSVLYTVPFALIQLLLRGALGEHDFSALRWVIFGGEPFPPAHLRALMAALPGARFDNMYGPAEVNGVTHYTVERIDDDDAIVPIGPIARSAEARVVNADDEPVGPGDVGELLVRSPTMMRGYWGREDLNAKAFYRCENAAGLDEVFFRTGDLVEQRDDGVFRFVGRKDRQVKVRGYRVELDEIETALTANGAVEEAAVFTLPDGEGSQAIHGQVTLTEHENVDGAALIKYLKKKLPWYAVPAAVSIAARFPRTSTGKIDRRLLRLQAHEAMRSAAAGSAP